MILKIERKHGPKILRENGGGVGSGTALSSPVYQLLQCQRTGIGRALSRQVMKIE